MTRFSLSRVLRRAGCIGEYLRDRVCLSRTLPGLLAFSLFAVMSSAHLGVRTMPGLTVCAVSFLVTILAYVQMLVFQDIRDTLLEPADSVRQAPEDERVTIIYMIVVGGVSMALSLLILYLYDPFILSLGGMVWIWLGLVLAGYFAPEILRRVPTLSVIGHMVGAPLVGFLLTSLEWGPARQGMPDGLWTVLLMFFANMVMIDIGERIVAYSRTDGLAGSLLTTKGVHAPIAMMFAAAVAAYASLIAYGTYLDLGMRFAEIGVLMGIPFACGLVGVKVYPNWVMEVAIRSWSRAWMVICYALASVVPLIWDR